MRSTPSRNRAPANRGRMADKTPKQTNSRGLAIGSTGWAAMTCSRYHDESVRRKGLWLRSRIPIRSGSSQVAHSILDNPGSEG